MIVGPGFSIANANRFLLVVQRKLVLSVYFTRIVPCYACLKLHIEVQDPYGYAHGCIALRSWLRRLRNKSIIKNNT